ncbi:hypothetical protein [Robertkochia aurantiaca]|uniref:hypothetical protein n=1 Tax=Robertkochia aurantiaca TaxID=2873700 RepID=UPI001CCCD673|nr:hypothetical protein [Robertkochia sp. 3YJGBD-33]
MKTLIKSSRKTILSTTVAKLLKVALLSVLIPVIACSDEIYGELDPIDNPVESQPYLQELQLVQERFAKSVSAAETVKMGYSKQLANGLIAPEVIRMQDNQLVDNSFDLLHPEEMIYYREGDGSLTFAGVSYLVRQTPDEQVRTAPQNAPEGFAGSHDVWRYQPKESTFRLNVWIGIENPDGVFAYENPAIALNTVVATVNIQ